MFTLCVMSYDGGKPKLDIHRLKYGAGQEGLYLKLGRLARHELAELLPVLQEALDYMEGL